MERSTGPRRGKKRSDPGAQAMEATSPGWKAALTPLEPGLDSDVQIDGLVREVIDQPVEASPEQVAALLTAARTAEGPFTRRDVAFAMATAASPAHREAVDGLLWALREWGADEFLGPEVFHALAVLAERSPLALSETRSQIVRLSPEHPPSLLIRAAKTISRLETLGLDTGARGALYDWAGRPDAFVQAEARQQIAVLSLFDLLRAEDPGDMMEGLRQCRVAFERAGATEELRFDAYLLLAITDLLLVYLEPGVPGSAPAAPQVEQEAKRVLALLSDPAARSWYGYASPAEQMIEHRALRIAHGLSRIGSVTSEAEAWTNYDDALVELAAIPVLMQDVSDVLPSGLGPANSLNRAWPQVVRPRLGRFLGGVVRRAQFDKVITRYEARHGNDTVSAELRRLHDWACTYQYAPAGVGADTPPSPEPGQIVALALADPTLVPALRRAFPSAEAALKDAGLEISRSGEAPGLHLAIDNPGLYGNDPNVDEAVRAVLASVRGILGPTYRYWHEFVDVVVALAQITRDIQNDLPAFARCSEDGGKGRHATERDLQDYAFTKLRDCFGRGSVYEGQRIAGGRSDNGVRIREFDMPIEVKAEHATVDRSHIRENYLSQVDAYATARDRVAALLVLDLRKSNAGGHLKRRRALKREGVAPAAPASLYSVRDSYWVDQLPGDRDVGQARANALLVGLVQGNRPRPSRTTAYSRAPKRP